jgi:integrase
MGIESDRAFPFTESRIEEAIRLVRGGAAETKANGRRVWRDAGSPNGLHLVVGLKGAAFYRIAKVAGRKTEVRIGDALAMRVTKARDAARALAAGDKSAAAPAVRIRTDGATVDEVWRRYIEAASSGDFIAGRKRTAESTLESYGFLYRPHIKPKYGKRSLHALAADVHTLHKKLRDKPVVANRLLQVVSNMFVFAARSGLWDKPNPTLDPITGRTIRKHHVASRARFLTTAEATRVLAFAATEPDPWCDFWRLMILTGIRVSNVREMKWSQLDLRDAGATWAIPTTKNGQPHESPLSADAVAILRARLERAPKGTGKGKGVPVSEWVFPMAEDPTRCIADTDHAWNRVRAAAGIKDVRQHDLRRTAGSWATQGGAPLTAVGQFIGDKSINATAVYARSDTAQARQVAEIIEQRLREAAGGSADGKTK